MQVPTVRSLVAASLCTLFIIQFKDTKAIPVRKISLLDPKLTLEVLDEVRDVLIGQQDLDIHKRRMMDAGYGGRYGVASSVGSKLMALKQAADWNGPGRKRRDIPAHHGLSVSDPMVSAAILDELIDSIRAGEGADLKKRRTDMGYGNRYGVASSVGSKLMALKQAADWNGPGRKKRHLNEETAHEQ